jgi:hypothetical protein
VITASLITKRRENTYHIPNWIYKQEKITMADSLDRRKFLKTTLAASTVGMGVASTSLHAESGTDSGNTASTAQSLAGYNLTTMDRNRQILLDEMAEIPAMDCHQHLWPESERVAVDADVLLLFHTYAFNDLMSAGMKTRPGDNAHGSNVLRNTEVPLEERWKYVSPWLDKIKYGTSYRATALALRDLYGINELNDRTFQEASEKIREANKPGLYRWVLRERSNIRTSLVQNLVTLGYVEDLPRHDGVLTPVYGGPSCYQYPIGPLVKHLKEKYATKIDDLDTYLEVLTRFLSGLKKSGFAGFKYYATKPRLVPDYNAARKVFKEFVDPGSPEPIVEAVILDHVFKKAAEWDWTISVHCGGAYMDTRTYDTRDIIDTVSRYPETRFDLFHLGVPFTREIIYIAKMYANTTLDLCWCVVLSESMTRNAINEILDAVPVNKVIAFGADYAGDVENSYGCLLMVRETLAEALAERIALGRLDLDDARQISRMWLHDNPASIYRFS